MEMAEWTQLWEEYYPLVYAYLHRRVNSAQDAEQLAEDLTSEVFLKAIRAAREETEIQQMRAWLFTIASRHLRDFYLKRARREKHKKTVSLEYAENIPDSCITPYEQVLGSAGCEIIWQCIHKLPENERRVLADRAQGYGLIENAETVGKTTGATKMILHRGREKLKTMLEREGYTW